MFYGSTTNLWWNWGWFTVDLLTLIQRYPKPAWNRARAIHQHSESCTPKNAITQATLHMLHVGSSRRSLWECGLLKNRLQNIIVDHMVFIISLIKWRWIGISHGYHQFLDKSSWNLLCLSAHEPLRCCDGSLCFQEAGCMSGFSTKGTKKSLSAASPSHGTWWPVCFWSSCWTKKNGLG